METKNFIFFLGTAGTRFNVINQARSSGGMWLHLDGMDIVIDPGPGSLVRICENRPSIDPQKIDALLLTHRHIDHSCDINILAEAMTGGGKKTEGFIGLSPDSLNQEPVLYSYLQKRVKRLVQWKEGSAIYLNDSIKVETLSLRHHHVDCYGLKFSGPDFDTWGIISDTAYIDKLEHFYSDCGLVIANVTLLKKVLPIEHLSVPDIEDLLTKIAPSKLVMTHFGTKILEHSTDDIAKRLTNSNTRVIAAKDGMLIPID